MVGTLPPFMDQFCYSDFQTLPNCHCICVTLSKVQTGLVSKTLRKPFKAKLHQVLLQGLRTQRCMFESHLPLEPRLAMDKGRG